MSFSCLARSLSLSLLVLSLSAIGCGPTDEQELATESASLSMDADAVEALKPPATPCDRYCTTNCVSYANCRTNGRLPAGLYSWADKQRAGNSNSPRKGCVAMIDTGTYYGHVAYVSAVSGDKITIQEGNWNNDCNERTNTKSKLHIYNYWCP